MRKNAALVAIDPIRDLVLERTVDVCVEHVWAAWTEPERLKRWFTPQPWTTIACEIDLRPGGIFRTTMRSPDGQTFDNAGCYLEIVPRRRLVWTGVLGPGFRPAAAPPGGLAFTAIISLAPDGAGTHYAAAVLHADAESRAKHAAMGFETGWGRALDQLVATCRE